MPTTLLTMCDFCKTRRLADAGLFQGHMTVLMQAAHSALQRIGKRAAVVPKPLWICSKVPAPVSPHHCTRICSSGVTVCCSHSTHSRAVGRRAAARRVPWLRL